MSVACRRLDGGNTPIFSKGENVNEFPSQCLRGPMWASAPTDGGGTRMSLTHGRSAAKCGHNGSSGNIWSQIIHFLLVSALQFVDIDDKIIELG